jgi:hypothetical protein
MEGPLFHINGIWSGTISNEESSKSVQGYSFYRYDLTGKSFSATIKKEDDSIYELTVRIVYEDKVLARGFTRDEYGSVSISYTFPAND